ncbi:hypothetical protein TNCT_597681 [Trichonephila clavata]|uniref:DNA (cytosine-5-)-methyltransferase n=1 Tax=Trichonephila clavata TaxID=2740835 RepID=A0A8X6JIF7_TRICU|nr:hypothetical protein TNCT_597681 [Trichonephila clavata]
MPKRGDFVWGKMRSFPWWPAVIIDPNDCGRDEVAENSFWVFWFGDHKVAEIKSEKLLDFKQHFTKRCISNIGKSLKQAIEEVLVILARRHHIKFSDPSSLFDWAKKGFKTKLPASYVESNSSELPSIVLNALKSSKFQRKSESESEEEDESEISNTLADVFKGCISLEDICIMCCKPHGRIVMKHPLFIGGVCLDCKKAAKKIAMGKTRYICVICGLGGELVLCSLSNCLRSYCKVCLDYMALKDSYSKILKNDNWRCYFCEINPNPRCFIKRRENFHSVPVELPAVPEEKLPISVMASNNAALTILMKKKFEIGVYRTETANKPEHVKGKKKIKDSDEYADFGDEEFAEIRPDFIYGSFFVSSISFCPSTSSTDDRKTCLDAFAAAFYRFLFRLDNARLCKPFVFFIFLSDGNLLDAEVMSRVMQFLTVDPVKIELSSKYLYLWTNVPPFKYDNFY